MRESEERMRKLENNEEIVRDSLSPSSFSLYFLPHYPFPIPKNVTFCSSVKYGTFVTNVTKSLYTRYEKIILGRFRCEEAPQVVPTLYTVYSMHRIEYSQVQGEPQGFQSDPPASRR